MVWAVPLAKWLTNEARGSCCPEAAACAVSWLGYLISFFALTSDPLHEGTYLSGEFSLAVPAAQPKLGPTVNFNLCLTATQC